MQGDYFINELPLQVASVRTGVEEFLAANGLRYDRMDRYVAVTADEDGSVILAGGGLCGDVIKCVAVSGTARSEGLMNVVVSRLLAMADEAGHHSVKVFTKPENLRIFASLGFRLLAQSREAVLMENGDGLTRYLKYLSGQGATLAALGARSCGIIVMNANPFTLGHRYLVETAASRVARLYVIAVKEDKSRFPYPERLAMIRSGCSGLDNVTVLEGSDYVISEATFPTYFLKDLSLASGTQIDLDLNLFTNHIAPELGVTVRFAGSEPEDALTRRYNERMSTVLPMNGIDYVEIPRLQKDGVPVSASALRDALDHGTLAEAAALAYPSAVPYLLADLAETALREELDTTPKPGLVDRDGCGSHKDMSYRTMSLGIDALRPYLVSVAVEASASESGIDPDVIRSVGLEAEKAMLEATGGVNTHRGALFCLGLSVAAASVNPATEDSFRKEVARIASAIPAAGGSHGAAAVAEYGASGALENARGGYGFIFKEILPFARTLEGDGYRNQKILLRIMASLDDTNILHRAGKEGLEMVRRASAEVLEDFSPEALGELCARLTTAGISPGGAADMLALTLFLLKIFP